MAEPTTHRQRFGSADAEAFTAELQNQKSKQATKYSVKLLQDYMSETNIDGPIKTLAINDLSNLLADFFANVRNLEGEFYSKSTMIAIRQGIRRYLQEPPLEKDFDIIKDPRMNKANAAFKSDIRKLYHQTMYMTPDSPQGLLNKVLLETILYFCRRGRENIRELDSSDFEIKYDADGRKYITKVKSEQTKNHQGTTKEDESDGGRMYATGSRMCPVSSFEKYLSKRNSKCSALFQHPKSSFCDYDNEWYENEPIGKNMLGSFMANLSTQAKLSEVYTNHCIRATTITELNREGFKDRDIIAVSGHQSTTALESYVSVTSLETKSKMSDVLSNITHTNDNFLDSNITDDINNNKPIDNNVPTQLCEIDFLDIDNQDLLSAFDDIEIQQYGVSSGNTNVVQTENTCRNTIHAVSNPASFNFSNCTATINYNGKP